MESFEDIIRDAMTGKSSLNRASASFGFIQEQTERHLHLAHFVDAREGDIYRLERRLQEIYQPEGRSSFLEAGQFEEYPSLHFFYRTAEYLDMLFTPVLNQVSIIPDTVKKSIEYLKPLLDYAHSSQSTVLTALTAGSDLKSLQELLHKNAKRVVDILMQGTIPFEEMIKQNYKQAIDHYRYLQKRFLDMGAEEARAYRAPWEREESHGYDLSRVPYVKIELIRGNPILTDMLLDIAENLPKQQTRKKKVRGKRKPKEIKYVDRFNLERSARVLMEIANPTYQWYVANPGEFLNSIADNITAYYDIMSALETPMKGILEAEAQNPHGVFKIEGRDYRKPMADPSAITSRLKGIDYMSVQPNEEDVRPSGRLEGDYFRARRYLLEHLAESIDKIVAAHTEDEKFQLALSAVEKGVQLRQKAIDVIDTQRAVQIKRDKKSDNEFYIGTSGQFGEFVFEREPAPTVKLKHVFGRSFDAMKTHLEDLAEYAKHLSLYAETAPRGKIRSNMIALGPYGCGKTEIGRAIAADPRFIGAEVSVTDALTCWFGEFEKNVDRVWDAARELRRKSGDSKLVFLLMDEFDAWFSGNNQQHWVDQTYRRVQKTIQMKLDGVVDYEGIITVGFSNEPAAIPLAIYRRFKYVDIVGELEKDERIALLKHFLTNGLPLSTGFRSQHYDMWGEQLGGATGDVIGKVTDDIHLEFMREFIGKHPKESRALNNHIRKAKSNGDGLDRSYVKRTIGGYMRVTPDWVGRKLTEKMKDPIIVEQINAAERVYAEARQQLANLQERRDAASGHITGDAIPIEYRIGHRQEPI